jgi:hypothetical protein
MIIADSLMNQLSTVIDVMLKLVESNILIHVKELFINCYNVVIINLYII